jgi:hypothetical protein
MTPLAKTFRKDGFDFAQIDRVDDVAVYHKTKGAQVESFEVVIVQKRAEHTWPNGDTTPAHESMPSSESWGTLGWTLPTKLQAYSKVAEVLESIKEAGIAKYKATKAIPEPDQNHERTT